MQCYDFVMAGVMYLISGIMFLEMRSIKSADSRLLPTIVAIVLIFLATCLIWSRIKHKEQEKYEFQNSLKGVYLVGILLAFTICADLFGFYVCTPFFLVIAMLFLGQRNKKVLIMTPIIMATAVVVLFYYIFQIPLPEGTVFNIFDFIR